MTDYEEANIAELKRALVFTSLDDNRIKCRHYELNPQSKINETDVKNKTLKLNELGPRFDLCFRRDRIADPDLYKAACKQPKAQSAETARNKKNMYTDEFG